MRVSRIIDCECGTKTRDGTTITMCVQCNIRTTPPWSVLKEERRKERAERSRLIRKYGKKKWRKKQ